MAKCIRLKVSSEERILSVLHCRGYLGLLMGDYSLRELDFCKIWRDVWLSE